jgi:hypothetical protein
VNKTIHIDPALSLHGIGPVPHDDFIRSARLAAESNVGKVAMQAYIIALCDRIEALLYRREGEKNVRSE